MKFFLNMNIYIIPLFIFLIDKINFNEPRFIFISPLIAKVILYSTPFSKYFSFTN